MPVSTHDCASWAAQPWFAPLRDVLPLLAQSDARAALNHAARARGIVNARGQAIEFVAAGDSGREAYEAHIFATGRVPTRENLHDLFNALYWLTLPRLKGALNALQAHVIAREGVGATRGRARDLATLIDESGLLLCCADPAVGDALARRDWQRLLVDWRARWRSDIVAVICGHALLEKLTRPYKALTAHVLVLDATVSPDHAAAQRVEADGGAGAALELLPLPVLGIPGWWPANEDPRFYADAQVFRPMVRDDAQ
ncbi:MAG TPA: DUF3025 domain-containing protein [Burkholderiaceae bacterium]|nr:DUF3025 domain-containing protein [Burkholderiaceae bacterium]